MFFILSKLLDLLLSPYSWALVLLLLSLRAKPTWRFSPRILGALSILILYVFSLEPVASYLWKKLEDSAANTFNKDDKSEPYDAVVLLGGLLDEGAYQRVRSRSYNDNVDRLLATFDLLRTGRARYVIISGGSPSTTLENAESRVLRTQLVEWGIASDRILAEDLSRNTWENATYSKKMAEEHHLEKLLVVTSAFHMERALGCFHAAGLTVDTLPVDYRANATPFSVQALIPRSHFLNDSCIALREFAGRLIYRLRGYSKA